MSVLYGAIYVERQIRVTHRMEKVLILNMLQERAKSIAKGLAHISSHVRHTISFSWMPCGLTYIAGSIYPVMTRV